MPKQPAFYLGTVTTGSGRDINDQDVKAEAIGRVLGITHSGGQAVPKREPVTVRVVSMEMADGTDINSPEAKQRIARALL